jgi:HEPN domain-containing protein
LSKLIVTRDEFKEMAEQRQGEAKILLDQGKWDGAYYLAGYAVELALKACIIKVLLATDAFPDREFSKNCYTHSLERLLGLAKLDADLIIARHADPDLNTNWLVALGWSEERRYHRMERAEAEALYNAIADGSHGVLPWIKTHW